MRAEQSAPRMNTTTTSASAVEQRESALGTELGLVAYNIKVPKILPLSSVWRKDITNSETMEVTKEAHRRDTRPAVGDTRIWIPGETLEDFYAFLGTPSGKSWLGCCWIRMIG